MYCRRVFTSWRFYNELKQDTIYRVHDNDMSFISNIKNVKRTALMLQIHVSETEISDFFGGIFKFQMSRFVFQNTPRNFV